MIIAAAPPLAAILLALGALGWLDFRLNIFLNVMTPLIMVISFSDSMQLTFAARDRLIMGDDKFTAFRNALLIAGPACVLTHATAGISFIALQFSSSDLIRTFGEAGLIATLIALVAVIMLVPLLGVLLIRNEAGFAASVRGMDKALDVLRRFCSWIAVRMVTHPGLYTLAGLLVVVALSIGYSQLQPHYRLADQVPDRQQAVAASRRLDAKLTGANPIDVLIEFPQGKSLYDPETLAAIADVHSTLEHQEGVGNVWSLETLRRWLAEKLGKTDVATLKQYVDMLPPYLTRRFISAKQDAVIVNGRVPDADANKLLPIVDELDKKLGALKAKYPGYTIAVTGLSVIAARNSAIMIDKLSDGLTIEIVFVAAFIGLAFRSFIVMLTSILPGLFPIVLAGCLLWVSGLGLQFASVIALTVSFGSGLERDDSLPQPAADRRHRAGPGRGRRARDHSRRTAADPDLGRARLRAGDDGFFQPAVAAPVRMAERLCDDLGSGRRPAHPAADRDFPHQDRAPSLDAAIEPLAGRIDRAQSEPPSRGGAS